MSDERTWMALVEREREARQMAERLLESKADEFMRSEGQWLEFLLETEKRLSVEVETFRDQLAEGLCQEISAVKYFLAAQPAQSVIATGVDQIQEHANDILRVVEKSPFIAIHPSWDEVSMQAVRTFSGYLPKSQRNEFNRIIHRIVAVWPIWDESRVPLARIESDGKITFLKLEGKRQFPLGNRLFDALIRRPALQAGINQTEFFPDSGNLTIRFRI